MANANLNNFNPNAVTWSFYDQVGYDVIADAARVLPTMPTELINEVAMHLGSTVDVANMRLVNKRYCSAVHQVLMKALVDDKTLYPRYGCFGDLLSLLGINFSMGVHVRKITLVADGLRAPEHGYAWAWEDLENQMGGLDFTDNDIAIINKVNRMHATDLQIKGPFVNSGGYRTMATQLLSRLPNLETIEIRKLKQGEHAPYWDGPELLKELSFYKEDLNTNGIYYGDWKYDTRHYRVTTWIDEFGDEISEDDAGPQASFADDFKAAIQASGTEADIILI